MRKTLFCLGVIILHLNMTFASDVGEAESRSMIAHGITDFGCDVNRMLIDGNNNHVFSPFSLSSVFSLLFAGTNGETTRVMSEKLHFSNNNWAFHNALGGMTRTLLQSQDSEGMLTVANDLWLNRGLKILPDFSETLHQAYGISPKRVNFMDSENTTKIINDYIAERTMGKISGLFEKIPSDSQFVLTNAIYFKSLWAKEFLEEKEEDVFTLNDGMKKTVEYMKINDSFLYKKELEKEYIIVPYSRENMVALVVAPFEGMMHQFEQSLTSEVIEGMMSNAGRTDVDFFMPAFTLETSAPSMKNIVTALGMGIIFDTNQVDLSAINGIKKGDGMLAVSDVVHKAYIEVNEKGTEAAAASGISGVFATSVHMPDPAVEFRVNRPFYFLIVDTTNNLVTFMARVMNP